MSLWYLHPTRIPTEKAHGYQIAQMCSAFAEEHGEVVLLSPPSNTPNEHIWVAYDVPRTFRHQTTFVRWYDRIFAGILGQRLLFVYRLFIFFIRAKWCVHRETVPPDIIYTRSLFGRLFFRRAVLELHQLPKRIRWYHRALLQAGPLVVLTHLMKNDLISAGIRPEHIHVAPDGVDLARYANRPRRVEARAHLGLTSEQRTIVLYTGSFFRYAWKGVAILLDAAIRLDPTRFVVFAVGATAEEKLKLQKLTIAYPHIQVLERVAPSEVLWYVSAADIAVLPNTGGAAHGERHTSPLKLFEYMAAEIPIVASDMEVLREVLTEKTAYFARPGDAEHLAQTILFVDAHPEEAKQKALGAAQKVQQYSWQKRAKDILHFLPA